MKKFLIGIFILFIAVSCTQNKSKTDDNSSASAEGDSLLTQRITLNGIPFDEADRMVKAFQSDQLSSDLKTNVWFGEKYIEEIGTLLDTEKADGFRIYFARKADGKNTVVMVSTRDNGGSTDPNRRRHKDYFEHSSPFLSTAEAKSKEDYGNDAGAILYKPTLTCPAETCRDSENRVSCADAHQWVRQFGASSAKFTTKAVWFDKELLHSLRDELKAAPGGDGIRMYFALKPTGNQNVVIVTTKSGRKDYLECYNSSLRSVDDNGEECPHLCQEDDATWN